MASIFDTFHDGDEDVFTPISWKEDEDLTILDDPYDEHSQESVSEEDTGMATSAPAPQEKDQMFSIQNIDWKKEFGKQLVGNLTMMAVGHNVLLLAFDDNSVLRWDYDLDRESVKTIEMALPKERMSIHRVFMDPSGCNSIICFDKGYTFFLHGNSVTAKEIQKLRNKKVEAVAWDRKADDVSTGIILFGTSEGEVFEGCFEGTDRKISQVFQLKAEAGSVCQIAGIHFERFPSRDGDAAKFFVMIVSADPTRIYQFVGGPTMEKLFHYYSNVLDNFEQLPGESTSALRFHGEANAERNSQFGMLICEDRVECSFLPLSAPFGVFHGNLLFASQSEEDNRVVTEPRVVQLPEPKKPVPVGLGLTRFHSVLIYPQHMIVTSRLLNSAILSEPIPGTTTKKEMIRGVSVDSFDNSIWFHSLKNIYKLDVCSEERNVWQQYLKLAQEGDLGAFDNAIMFAKTASHRNRVRIAQAEYHYGRSEMEDAARCFARANCSFEEAVLKFVGPGVQKALKVFLSEKLKLLGEDEEQIQRTTICTWLTDLYLGELSGMRPDDPGRASVVEDFHSFLLQYADSLHKETTFHLISSHGLTAELLEFANIVNDYERLVTHFIQAKAYEDALTTIRKAPPETAVQLHRRFATDLLINLPRKTCQAWALPPEMDPIDVLPALVQYTQHREEMAKEDPTSVDSQDWGLRYLEYAVFKKHSKEPAIHNELLTRYVLQKDDVWLMKLLKHELSFDTPLVDFKQALRECVRGNQLKAAVFLYSKLELHEEAVEKALEVDLELAKEQAKAVENKILKQKLWGMIAKHSVEHGADVRGAVAIVEESKCLSIEDILPFFKDNVSIDAFQEHVERTLDEYEGKISELRTKMQSYETSAKAIRRDIHLLRNRYRYVSANQRCELCKQLVLTNEFFVFPCSHCFHTSCLEKAMPPHLTPKQKAAFLSTKGELAALHDSPDGLSERPAEVLHAHLASLIAAECMLCGRVMIDSIDKPFAEDPMD